MNEKKKKEDVVKKGEVSAVMKESEAKNYMEPPIHMVLTKITADDPKFIPTYPDKDSSHAQITANVKTATGNTILGKATVAEVDFGFNLKIKTGYKIKVKLTPEFANRGLMICSNDEWTGDVRAKIMVISLGKENPFAIKNGDKVAQICAEPIYRMELKF